MFDVEVRSIELVELAARSFHQHIAVRQNGHRIIVGLITIRKVRASGPGADLARSGRRPDCRVRRVLPVGSRTSREYGAVRPAHGRTGFAGRVVALLIALSIRDAVAAAILRTA